MNISHDGDRVSRTDADGKTVEFRAPTSNAHLLNLIEDLESGDPQRVLQAQLHQQPGSYHCSLPAIDRMVDIALATEGAAGAQLAGAGLGGCMMVFAHRSAVEDVRRRLTEGYYEPSGHDPRILVCRPIAGAGVLMMPD
jgi:N-acetylgalactosamine kinase